MGHVFRSYPRREEKLNIRVTPWKSSQTAELTVANPHVVAAKPMVGQLPPLTNRVGDLEVVLSGLSLRTNGSPRTAAYETRSIYHDPVWKLLRDGTEAGGWEAPEWVAEDATGNRGRMLAPTEPVLRYSATIYPSATNSMAAVLATAPSWVPTPGSTNIVWWNLKAFQGTNSVEVPGLFPAGVHVFSQGAYQTNPPVRMMPVRGGAPSGWVGQGRWTTPTRYDSWNGHYTPVPVVYVHAVALDPDVRLGVRLRDSLGRVFVAKPEEQGSPNGVHAFLVELPPDVTNVTAEVVELRPIKASFDVVTGAVQP